MSQTVYETRIASLPLLARGKVRDIYAVGDERLLIVTTDRLSAFDVILPDPIPDKGRVLTAVSNFWFDKLGHIIPNHLSGIDPESVVKGEEERAQVRGRSVVVKRLKPLPIEAVVRGYIIGSGWKDYQKTGAVCGIPLPAGLKLAQKLPSRCSRPPPRPRWARTTKTSTSPRWKRPSAHRSPRRCATSRCVSTGRLPPMP